MSASQRPPPKEVPTLTEVVGFAEPPVLTVEVPPAPPVSAPASASAARASPAASPPVVARSGPRTRRAAPPAEPVLPEFTLLASADTPLETWLELNEDQITQRVLTDVQRQVDKMLEFRLRESLAPLLERLVDGIINEVREELALTMRDVVRRAVAQELSRYRPR